MTLERVTERISELRRLADPRRSLLVALSGIDGSGKGYVAARLCAALNQLGLRAINLNLDAWLNLPANRFDPNRPAEHFYRHALRFAEMFEQLVLPLKGERSVRVETDFAEETATEFRRQRWEYDDVDVILLEGIYLLKREYLDYYDLKVWIECGFETALVRALRRGQEGLPFDETIRAYQTIYFPAQLIHFALDDPRASADLVIENDRRG